MISGRWLHRGRPSTNSATPPSPTSAKPGTPVRSPGAMTAALAGCYTAERLGRRCRWAGNHDCGTGALAADRARRYDEDGGRWRQARTDYWTALAPVATQDEAAPLDADYWRLQLVPYLQEQGADDATYEAWGVPAEYRPANRQAG